MSAALPTDERIETRLARTPGQWDAIDAFIRTHAYNTHGCEAPPCSPRGFLFGAWQDEVVVGSMYIEFRDDHTPHPLEEVYGYDAVSALFCDITYRRSIHPQAGRWFSSKQKSSVSLRVLHEACRFAAAQGIEWLISEGRPYTFKRLRELGIILEENAASLPDLSKVPLAGRRYYQSDPPPCLFRMRCDTFRPV